VQNAGSYFKNLDKLIYYINKLNGTQVGDCGRWGCGHFHASPLPLRLQVKAIYSTPSTYVRARLATDVKLHSADADFFPYFDGDNR